MAGAGTKYRDLLGKEDDLGIVVGSGLDRLQRDVSEVEIYNAIDFYKSYKAQIDKQVINERRQAICDFIASGQISDWIKV